MPLRRKSDRGSSPLRSSSQNVCYNQARLIKPSFCPIREATAGRTAFGLELGHSGNCHARRSSGGRSLRAGSLKMRPRCQVWEDLLTQPQKWALCAPADPAGPRWELANDVLKEMTHRQPALKFRFTATASGIHEMHVRRKELSVAR